VPHVLCPKRAERPPIQSTRKDYWLHRLVLAGAIFAAITDARAERLACPPEPKFEWTKPAKEGTWEKQYEGWIEEVRITRMRDKQGGASVFVRCTRSSGSIQIMLSKACRFIAGKGAVELADRSKVSEVQVCKMPTTLSGQFRWENDESCMVECN
jgi:hypothetical protein